MGDGMLIEFGSIVDAVACAVAIQKELADPAADASPSRLLVLRIGINLGDIVVDGDDVLGDAVNIAARLEQLCEPGGVLISGTAYDHMQGKLGLPLDFVGEEQVKNIERPVRELFGAAGRSAAAPPTIAEMAARGRAFDSASRRRCSWRPLAIRRRRLSFLAAAGAGGGDHRSPRSRCFPSSISAPTRRADGSPKD